MRWRCLGLVVLSLQLGACATLSHDLERARRHYQALEFPQALSLLRLVGEDYEALSPKERVQFSYLRGMTDFRLADSVPDTGTTRAELRACSRDWLEHALDIGRVTRGGLTVDQARRARATLTQLVDVERPKRACLPPPLAKPRTKKQLFGDAEGPGLKPGPRGAPRSRL